MDRLLRKGRTEELGKVKLLKNKKKRVKQFKNSLERRFFFSCVGQEHFPPFCSNRVPPNISIFINYLKLTVKMIN